MVRDGRTGISMRRDGRVFWILSVALSLCFSIGSCSLSEGQSLIKMMSSWGVNFPTWTVGGDPCVGSAWDYVTCDNAGRVINLNVSNKGLTGGLPEEVGDLTHLEVLDISNCCIDRIFMSLPALNHLTGALPDSLGKLTNLKSLNLSNNNWNTPFPLTMTKLTMLEELYMSIANITGSLPDELFNLIHLRSLFLGSNLLLKGNYNNLRDFSRMKNLTLLSLWKVPFGAKLPEELGSLTQMEYFNVHTAGLYGGLPESYGQWSNIQNITLHRNSLSGAIPDSWKQWKTIKYLRIDGNFISGSFPMWMFDTWPNLDSLFLSRNNFYGIMPVFQTLDQKYNLSYRFNILRWDCNYLSGYTPCRENNDCSPKIKSLLGSGSGLDVNLSFVFTPNCYSDSTKQEQDDVMQCSQGSHTQDCSDFANQILSEKCPLCPRSQNVVAGVAGERCVCDYTDSKKGGIPVGAAIGVAVALIVVFFLILGIVLWKRRKQFSFFDIFNTAEIDDENWEVPPGVRRFSVGELARVTKDFSDDHMIGIGGFGKVFVGTLDDGKTVAIKRASARSLQDIRQFQNEVSLLSRLHHRHLVRLEGFCDCEGFQILVYDYMKNGNLHTHLFGKPPAKKPPYPLHWFKRMEIAYGVAQGLEYLHSFADPPVIHRDVKPSNILLDENMMAKLADFGISKESPNLGTHVTTKPAGTLGYLDPESYLRQQWTTASDVYAFGVVLLILITGQLAIDVQREEEYNLIEWVKIRFRTAGILSIIDPLINPDYPKLAYAAMTDLALSCAAHTKKERPTMKEA